jgi:DNA modification methylase
MRGQIDITESGCYVGDCRDLLRKLPAGCVQTCITSPPYWGLRDYDHERQIGVEPTPEAYVAALVGVFKAVWRVLRDDGTLWLNLGDSYSHGGCGARDEARWPKQSRNKGSKNLHHVKKRTGLKPKDLVGIPWRVAFALRDQGWYLRMDNIWSKPNPMPESVTDRTTKAHEYLFHFAKSESYFYNKEAIAEPAVWMGQNRTNLDPVPSAMPSAPPHRSLRKSERRHAEHPVDRNKRSVWTVPGRVDLAYAREQLALWQAAIDGLESPDKGSVWTTSPQPYHGAHFATYPPALIEPCILACSRPGDLVLDPFFGSGTTGEVAEKHERRWIGFDLNPEYAALARERTAQRSLPLSR